MTPALEARALAIRFGGVNAVAGVSFAVAPGELVGLIGPNGAGKTTLMRIIAGVLAADAGEVAISGRRSQDGPPRFDAIEVRFQIRGVGQREAERLVGVWQDR